MTRITGVDRHLQRLKSNSAAVRREVGKAVVAAAELVRAEAVAGITAGSVSGLEHLASRPGEPPNADTGQLADGIEVQRGELTAAVISTAPYAADLEFGTTRMAARPYLRPAAAKKRQETVALVVQAVGRGRAGG